MFILSRWRVGETFDLGQVMWRCVVILLVTMLTFIFLRCDAALVKQCLMILRDRLTVLKTRVLWQEVMADIFTPDTIPSMFPFSVPIRPCMVPLGVSLATMFRVVRALMALTVRHGPIVVVLQLTSRVIRRILWMLLVLMRSLIRAWAPWRIRRRRMVEYSSNDGTGVRLVLSLWLDSMTN